MYACTLARICLHVCVCVSARAHGPVVYQHSHREVPLCHLEQWLVMFVVPFSSITRFRSQKSSLHSKSGTDMSLKGQGTQEKRFEVRL